MGDLIFTCTLHQLKDTVLDLSLHATPCRYRFMDCRAFLEDQKLNIYEFHESPAGRSPPNHSNTPFRPPNISYVAISYTWLGNKTNTDDPSSPLYWEDVHGTFQVKGAEDGDPISLDVLEHVCIVAAQQQSQYLWFDRLCILQTSVADKVWQITRMYSIYASCTMCCVLPGGIRRLVRLEEETSWIDRGWTLQEAVAPQKVVVLFRWDHYMEGRRCQYAGSMSTFIPQSVIDGQSAYAELDPSLQKSVHPTGCSLFIDKKEIPVSIGLFGTNRISACALLDSLHSKEGNETREQSIWRSALLRTSSRPVDMVFSIMNMFGVTLDPKSFDKDDRVGATIALAREILRKGGSASWIGAGYTLEPSREVSTFPRFPESSVAGHAYVVMSDGTQRRVTEEMSSSISMVTGEYLGGIPDGSMDEDGYLNVAAHATRIVRWRKNASSTRAPIRAADQSAWQLASNDSSDIPSTESVTYMVYIGEKVQSSSPMYPRYIMPEPLTAMLIQQHSPNKFHRIGFAYLAESWKKSIISFPKITLAVGGPNPPSRDHHHEDL